MKIIAVETLLNCGRYSSSKEWAATQKMLHAAIRRVCWPPGSSQFTIYPESGKRGGEGNASP